MENKKGNIGLYIGVVISLVLAVVILTSIAFPQWRTLTDSQVNTESLNAHVYGTGDTTTTLSYTDMVSGTLAVASLNLSNYSIDYDTGIVTVLNETYNGTYNAQYYYYAAGYIETTGSKAMAGVVILLLIVGLAAGGLKMFGVI